MLGRGDAMRKLGYAVAGSMFGAGAVVTLSYGTAYWRPLVEDNGALGVYQFFSCWFAFIGAMLGALGGLAVERRN
ncbi:MAG: hypothetical protein U0804_18190 [Gemmataceae bacterium]